MSNTSITPTRTASHRRRPAFAGWALGALVAALALFVVACGGGEDTAEAPRDAPSQGMATSPGSSGGGDDGAYGAYGEQESKGDFDAAAPSAGVPGGAAVTNLPSTLGRTILRDGSVGLEVESVSQSFERVRQIAEGAGGFVADSNFTGSGSDQSASLTLRIPAERFGDVLAQLQDIAVEVRSVSSSSQDVTEEYTDLESSLRNLRAVEQRYLSLLSEAQEIDDILMVQDRLNGVRYEIERIQGRVNLLDNLASLATVRVHLIPTPDAAAKAGPADPGFGDRVLEAWESSLEAIEAVGTAVVVAVVWSWWLLPLVVVALWLARRLVPRASPAARVDTPEGAA